MWYVSDFEIFFEKKGLTIKQQVEILEFLEKDNALGVITDIIKEENDKDSAYYADKLLPVTAIFLYLLLKDNEKDNNPHYR